MDVLGIISLILALVAAVFAVLAFIAAREAAQGAPGDISGDLQQLYEGMSRGLGSLEEQVGREAAATREDVKEATDAMRRSAAQTDSLRADVAARLDRTLRDSGGVSRQVTQDVRAAVAEVHGSLDARLASVESAVYEQVGALRQEGDARAAEIPAMVGRAVSQGLSTSLGDMGAKLDDVSRNLEAARDVSESVDRLNRLLSGVTTRGALGEVQCASILGEVLAPGQYVRDLRTREGSDDVADFAVRVPAAGGRVSYLPIDAKFPVTTYENFKAAVDSGDERQIALRTRLLRNFILAEAKIVGQTYVNPPRTTGFAVMYLPFEGLFAEVVNMDGLLERVQREWHVTIAGPSTLTAMLFSVQAACQSVGEAANVEAFEAKKVRPGTQGRREEASREVEAAEGGIVDTRGENVAVSADGDDGDAREREEVA